METAVAHDEFTVSTCVPEAFMSGQMPSSGKPHQVGLWGVYRQDDTGNRFTVKEGLTQEEAIRLVEVFESRGHKQFYWAAPQTTPE